MGAGFFAEWKEKEDKQKLVIQVDENTTRYLRYIMVRTVLCNASLLTGIKFMIRVNQIRRPAFIGSGLRITGLQCAV